MEMDYGRFCDEVLGCDAGIRYVGVYDYGELHDRARPGSESLLSREETELSLSQAVYRWSTRKKTTGKIGRPVFALAKYERIYRITVPIGGAGLALVSTDLGADVMGIVGRVLEVRDRHQGGTPR